MRKLFFWALPIIVALTVSSCAKSTPSKYETVEGDQLQTQIYTLDNGLKVYMTVNKETPRIQTYIAVRVGSKNDPHETTGLAHYLEHLMFKGTEQFGTSDYAAEKPLLDSIRALFEVYRTKTDPAERLALYHRIDSFSYEASKIAIPNEYDKLMSVIGADGTNAFTSNDMTVYTDEIPSNEIDNWAKIQSDRFMHPVIRGFHTELETVYEEKNMSLTQDNRKAMEAVDSVLFANHPYGQQTTIGTQQHLKNPSIVNIENYCNAYYVPNNVAICVSGDFDPDTFVATVEKYFGSWQPNPAIPELKYEPEAPITQPVIKDVYGLDAEFVMMGWRVPGSHDILKSEVGDMVSSVLYNGQAGLVDLDLLQGQKMNSAYGYNYTRPDYGEFILVGYPREGQTLDQVRDLLLQEVGKLRNGDFDENLLTSAINNYKRSKMNQLESNSSRAMAYVMSFINRREWKDDALDLQRMEKITKQDVIDWANTYLGENSYVAAYKHIGEDKNIEKIAAPSITPIETNRDKQSAFLSEIQTTEVTPIEPVFLDFTKDMTVGELSEGVECLYKKNVINDIARVYFVFDQGTQNDPRLNLAFDYLGYLGTPTRTAEDINKEMYALACDYGQSAGTNQSNFYVIGLDENMGKAIDIMEDLIFNAQPNEAVLSELKSDKLKERADAKLSQGRCFSALRRYIYYGPELIQKTTLTNEQLMALTSEELLQLVRDLYGKQHRVLYYGPQNMDAAKATLAEHHKTNERPEALVKDFQQHRPVGESEVFMAPYDANQFYYVQYSNRGEKFDVANDPEIMLYNQYFGGGMNSIVFQEMREARALAYSAYASLDDPNNRDDNYTFTAFIASQNDKLQAAVEAFDKIINEMPESEEAFKVAKSSMLANFRTNRTTGASVLFEYLSLQDLGLKEDRNKAMFDKIQGMTLADVKTAQEKWVKERTYFYGFLGDQRSFDMNYINTLGKVHQLTLEQIFGY